MCFLCLVFLMLSRLFIAALWSPAGKGLTSWLLLVMLIVFSIIFDSVLLCFILKVAFLHENSLREAV